MLGVQSDPRAQPCSPRLGGHSQAGVRPQVRGRGKESQWQSKLITQPDSKQTVHDLFHDSKGPAALLRGKQQEEAAWECRCCCCRPLCWPSPTGSHFSTHCALVPRFGAFLCWKASAEQTHQSVALGFSLGLECLCLSYRQLLRGKMNDAFNK